MQGLGPRPKRCLFVIGTIVCLMINFIDYCKDGNKSREVVFHLRGSVPIVNPPLSSCQQCNCTELRRTLHIDVAENSGQYTINQATTLEALHHSRRVNDDLVSMQELQDNVVFSEENGLKYLDHISLSRYYLCKPSHRLLLPITTLSENRCSKRKFRDNKSPTVALVSFHGSGNTWVRHLVEQATGIFTGSIYCDSGLKVAFPGESIVSGNVIVTKTHRSDSMELPYDVKMFTGKMYYDKAIILVRNPYDALISEANRRWNSKHTINDHLGIAAETTFISKHTFA